MSDIKSSAPIKPNQENDSGLSDLMPSTHQMTKNLTKKPYFYLYLIKVQNGKLSKEAITLEKKVKICDWATLGGVTSNRENHASKEALP